MRQLINHGKKTVPAEIRRDSWLPYFSVHFPTTPLGKYSGLLAYRRLKELSDRRQLEGPDDIVMATQEDVDKAKKNYDPIELDYILKEDEKEKNIEKKKIPVLGKLLRKKLRGKKLMDQKATSVADVAMVLKLAQEEEMIPTAEAEAASQGLIEQSDASNEEEKPLSNNQKRRLREAEEERTMSTIQRRAAERERRWQDASRTYRKRIRSIHEDEAALAATQKQRAEIAISRPRSGQVRLDKDGAHRIALNQDGILISRFGVKARDPHKAAALFLSKSEASAAKDTTDTSDDIDYGSFIDDLGARQELDLTPLTNEAPKSESQLVTAEKKAGEKPIMAPPNMASQVVKAARANTTTPSSIRILWSKLDDSEYAEAWPETVEHQQLKPKSEIRNEKNELVNSSIHVIADNFPEDKTQLIKRERRIQKRRVEDFNRLDELKALDWKFKANELYRAGLDIMFEVHNKAIEVRTASQSSEVGDDTVNDMGTKQEELSSQLEKHSDDFVNDMGTKQEELQSQLEKLRYNNGGPDGNKLFPEYEGDVAPLIETKVQNKINAFDEEVKMPLDLMSLSKVKLPRKMGRSATARPKTQPEPLKMTQSVPDGTETIMPKRRSRSGSEARSYVFHQLDTDEPTFKLVNYRVTNARSYKFQPLDTGEPTFGALEDRPRKMEKVEETEEAKQRRETEEREEAKKRRETMLENKIRAINALRRLLRTYNPIPVTRDQVMQVLLEHKLKREGGPQITSDGPQDVPGPNAEGQVELVYTPDALAKELNLETDEKTQDAAAVSIALKHAFLQDELDIMMEYAERMRPQGPGARAAEAAQPAEPRRSKYASGDSSRGRGAGPSTGDGKEPIHYETKEDGQVTGQEVLRQETMGGWMGGVGKRVRGWFGRG